MNKKKIIRYHLKKDVRDDLENLYKYLFSLLNRDLDGFGTIPSWSILPALFKVYVHLVWCRKFESWFKKVYL